MNRRQRSPLKPPRLQSGDLIGIISPSSPIADPTRIEKGVRYLESLGYRTTVGKHVGKMRGYLAGTDEERAADVHEMFSDRQVKAIVCVRGGYGTPRLLPLLNYRLIARNPKIFVGFSDVTALQLALWKKCNLITFHGPMAGVEMANTMDSFTEEMFWRCVTSNKPLGELTLPEEPLDLSLSPRVAIGRLLGGNLSLVVSLLGTAYQPDFAGALVFLEEIAEEPYRIDRMLMHLRNASVFAHARGMLFGAFTDCVPSDRTKPSLTVEEVLRDAAAVFAKPVLAGVPFGHVPRKLTIPIGLRARIDARRVRLSFLESSVR
jgi:muramoyltetrapeptide carboxypeptidase